MTERQVIRAKRLPRPWGLPYLGILALFGWSLVRSDIEFLSWLGWVLFAAIAVIGAALILQAIFPPHMVLTRQGFQVVGFGSRPLVRWSDVSRFWVVRMPVQTFVFYALADQKPRDGFGLWVFRGLPSEADGQLHNVYRVKPQALVDLLNEQKAQYGS